jgi:hypothetical protein
MRAGAVLLLVIVGFNRRLPLFENATPAAAADGVDYDAARNAALNKCRAIKATDAQTGLLFNPDGYRSFFVRSACLQDMAVTFRDADICADVKERRSTFFSSWGYSPGRCRELVQAGQAADRRELMNLRQQYEADGITIADFQIVRNGNGRDYDIVPTFKGRFAHAYTLTFDLAAPGGEIVRIYSTSTHVDASSRLRLYVPRTDLIARFPAFRADTSYPIRAVLSLDVGHGAPSGYWRPTFIEQLFPFVARSSTTNRTIRF